MNKEECEIETSKAIMEMRSRIAELEKENAELRNIAEFQQSSNMNRYFENKKLKDENTRLKEKISILLSCKNCPENKGGWICAKEYEGRCLSQKIEFIKELEKENAELKKENTQLKTRWECRNKYMCSDNGRGVPCYIYYGCLNCQFLLEKEVKHSEVEK